MTFHREWQQFLRMMLDARERTEDTFVPVCVILLQAERAGPEAVDVFYLRDGICLWPAEIPTAQRGPLLHRLAEPYDAGTVLRTDAEGNPL